MENNYEEVEAKFLNIDIEKIENKLQEFGAKRISEVFQQ
jgi:adenylate cyclase class IV